MKAIDLANVLKGYKTGWVSISKDNKKVISSARSLKALLAKLQKLGNPDGYIMKAARDYNNYVGTQGSF